MVALVPILRSLRLSMALGVFAGLASAVAALIGFAAWSYAALALALAGFTVAGIVAAAFEPQARSHDARSPLLVSSAITFTALLLLGSHAMTFVATAVTMAQALFRSRDTSARDIGIRAAAAVAATQAAGLVHALLGGTQGAFVWPLQGVPIAAAVVVYTLAVSVPRNGLRHCPAVFIAAGLAVG